MIRIAAIVLLASTLCACALSGIRGLRNSGTDWVEYALGLRDAPVAELEETFRQAEADARDGASISELIRLGLVSSDPRSPHYDLDRSLGYFDAAVRSPGPADDIEFARWMRGIVAERERLESAADAADAERAALQEQLDALIELEQRLNTGAPP